MLACPNHSALPPRLFPYPAMMLHAKVHSDRLLAGLVIIFSGAIVAFHFISALVGFPAFRDSHLGTALLYAAGPINLLRPIIVGFNLNGTPTLLELPIWQAAAGLMFKLAHSTWYGWANITSLLLFATCLWPLFQLASTHLDRRGAWWTLVFFLAQPLIIINSGLAGTDGLSLVFMIWFLFFADRLVRTGNTWWWLPTTLFSCLTAVSKLPFLMAAGIGAGCLLMLDAERRRSWRAWSLLGSAGLVTVVVFAVWTRYTDYQASLAEFPYTELRVSKSAGIRSHFFGTLSYRLSPVNWGKGGWRVAVGTLGSVALVPLPLFALFLAGNRVAKYLVLGVIVATLVFTHLVLVHWHYYLMVCPAVAMFCAASLRRLEQVIPESWSQPPLLAGSVGVALLLAAFQGLVDAHITTHFDRYHSQIAETLRKYTRPTDKLIVLGTSSAFSWAGGEDLIRSGRQGLTSYDAETLKEQCSGANLDRFRSLGFNRIVLVSESPLQAAIQQARPGSSYHRKLYPASISSTIDAWPVVFQNEDILIKEIPPTGN
jgi:hypothetical protein